MGVGRIEKPYRPRQYEHFDINSEVSDAEFHSRENAINDYERRVVAIDPHAFDEEKAERRRIQNLDLEHRISCQEPLRDFLASILDEENPNDTYDVYGINEKTTIAELKSIVNNHLSRLNAEYEELKDRDRYIDQAPDFDYEHFEKVRNDKYSDEIQNLYIEKNKKEEAVRSERLKIMRHLSDKIRETQGILIYLNSVLDTDDTIVDIKKRLDTSIELRQDFKKQRDDELRLAYEEARKKAK